MRSDFSGLAGRDEQNKEANMKLTALTLIAFGLFTGMRLPAEEPQAAKETPSVTQPALTLEAQCAAPFGDNAVFQQGIPLPVWGTSLPGAKVTVSFDKQTKTTVVGKDGKWKVTLDPLSADKLTSVNMAPEGKTLSITSELGQEKAGKNFKNILCGEVWLASGQSNMAAKFGRSPYPKDSTAKANYPALRNQEGATWTISTPQTVGNFSRVAFSFARKLQEELMVPVGILSASVSGTQIESWMEHPPAAIKRPNPKVIGPHDGGVHYEARIAPLVGYGMRGAIWYQGEANEKDGRKYFSSMQSLIGDWRKSWSLGDFPFYFVQLAPIGKSPTDKPEGGDFRAAIRNAQLEALTIKNTGMAVTMDIGAEREHPLNKYDVGLRLVRWALNKDYGQKQLVPSGPIYKGFKAEGSTIRVTFDYAQNGLMLAKKDGYESPTPTSGAKVPWLAIQAKDGIWHWADGVIDGSDLLVSCKDVVEPVAVRYAYTAFPAGCNLYNKDGLPASPFSTCGY